MFLQIGNRNVKHSEILFLSDIKDFTNRKIYKFFNPMNDKIHIILCETHIETKEVFEQKLSGIKALKVLEREKCRLLYTSYDITRQTSKPYGWVYGENKEIHDKNGNVIRTEVRRCDFHGQKELIESIEK